ncbi:hypothetical protein CONLIGDRAFT_680604 [Coniochaeta ligniaria NRRL 30616]|uniref:Uncharacterized protein n=1 Tax=Coniochaeta ligniaria NRRL 30616 TaxID=1408157 RepID=A0A1J7JKJ2_9PEZI|nr:hypothetical protein CONLIGDRAFT_680604 [Coniochaeta ligniaria NRRL 30616]
MSLLTAEFLECTPYTSVATSTVFVTSYCVTLPAACPTSEWIATYTITTTCTGDEAAWTAPAVPPEFEVTTVVCDVCAQKTQTITCPNAEATDVSVEGNGVTVTVAPTPGSVNTAAGAENTGAATGGSAVAPTVTGISVPSSTGTGAAESGYVTVAGAPLSMKKSLGLMAGLALIAGQFLML